MKLKLINRIQEASDAYSFIFEKPIGFSFTPGQFLIYTINNSSPDDRGLERYFTISSAPFENEIRLTTRFSKESSSFKKDLINLQLGSEIEVKGPEGDFFFDSNFENHLFISGGIGVTPFRSILLDLQNKDLEPNIKLFYANKNIEIVFQDELEELSNPNFLIEYFIADNKLTSEKIYNDFKVINSCAVYLSGPEPMVESFSNELIKLGVPEKNIKRDYFPGYKNI
jgi:ferredoxin-NADP reductase